MQFKICCMRLQQNGASYHTSLGTHHHLSGAQRTLLLIGSELHRYIKMTV